jgi:hypothetical protein
MIWEALVLLLAVWVLFLVLALFYLARSADGGWGHWSRVLSDRITAERRAHSLMRDMLSPVQYQQLSRHGYVEVCSPSIPHRVYRIPGAGGLVRVYEQGHAIMDLCLQPVDPLPDGDVVVMHKLMIEANEQDYLSKANHFAPGIITLRCGYL